MIPSNNGFLSQDFVIEEPSSQTYRMNFERLNIRGFTDKTEAMKQVIYKMLNTERYQYIIYSWNYGVELLDLYGQPISYVLPEIKRRITEALTYDNRIESVDHFAFVVRKSMVHTTFTVHTIFGDVAIEKAVNF